MRIIVFANGLIEDVQREVAAWVPTADLVVAANGGSHHALQAGVALDHVIGDLDSLPAVTVERLKRAGTAFHVSPEAKDETDLELALLWAAARPGVHEIVVLGAFGGRPDQAVANLLLLALSALDPHRVLLVQGTWVVQLIRPGSPLVLTSSPGDRLSLIPLGGPARGVTTEGLAFPLRDETLAFGFARGVSNWFEGNSAAVRVREGLVWCFHEQRILGGQG